MTTATTSLADRFRTLQQSPPSLADRFSALQSQGPTQPHEPIRSPEVAPGPHEVGEAYDTQQQDQAPPPDPMTAGTPALPVSRALPPAMPGQRVSDFQPAQTPNPILQDPNKFNDTGGVTEPIGFTTPAAPGAAGTDFRAPAPVSPRQQLIDVGQQDAQRNAVAAAQQAGKLGRIGAAAVSGTVAAAGKAEQGWRGVFQFMKSQEAGDHPIEAARQGLAAAQKPPTALPVDVQNMGAAVGAIEPNASDAYDQLAKQATGPEQLLAGLYSMPVQMLDPKAIAAILIIHAPVFPVAAGATTLTGKVLEGSAPIIQGLAKRFGPKFAGLVEKEIVGASGMGGFTGVQAALEGKSPEEIAAETGKGALTGMAFELPMGMAGMRGPRVAEPSVVPAAEPRVEPPLKTPAKVGTTQEPVDLAGAGEVQAPAPEVNQQPQDVVGAAQGEQPTAPPEPPAKPRLKLKEQPREEVPPIPQEASDAQAPGQEQQPAAAPAVDAGGDVRAGAGDGDVQPADAQEAPQVAKPRLRSKQAIEEERARAATESGKEVPNGEEAPQAQVLKEGQPVGDGEEISTPAPTDAAPKPRLKMKGEESARPEPPISEAKTPEVSVAAKDTVTPESPKPEAKSRLGKIADEARARRLARQAPAPKPGMRSGHANIIPDVIDLGIETAARFAETGEKFIKRQIGQVRKMIDEEAPHLSDRYMDVVHLARRIVRESTGKDGKLDEGLFERAVGKVQEERAGPDQPIKTTIREKTGQTRSEEKTVTASEALVSRLRGEEKAAGKAWRESRKVEREKAEFELSALRDKLTGKAQRRADIQGVKQRAKLETKVEQEKTRAAVADGVRTEVARIARENLPASERGKFVTAAAEAKTPEALTKVINRMRHVNADYTLRSEIADAARKARGGNPGKMLENNRKLYESAKADLKALRSKYQTLKTLHDKQAAALQAQDIGNMFREAKHRQKADEFVRVGDKVKRRETLVTEGVDAIKQDRKPLKGKRRLDETKRVDPVTAIHYGNLTRDTVGVLLNHPELRKMLADDFWDGEGRVLADHTRAQDFIRAAVEKQGYKWGSDELQRLSGAVSRDAVRDVAIDFPDAGKVSATPAEWMSLLATITDGDARGNILGGAGVTWSRHKTGTAFHMTLADMDALRSQLDPRWVKIVDATKEYLEKQVRPGVFKAHRDQAGWDLRAVKDYWPTQRNRYQPPPETLIGAGPAFVRHSLESLSFLQERAPDTKTPYLVGDFFDKFNEHTHKAAVWTHMTSIVRGAEMIFKDPRMNKAVEDYIGDQMNGQIGRQIEAGKLIFREPTKIGERAGSLISKNLAKADLTINPSTMLKQLGGVPKLAAVMDPKYVAKGMAGGHAAEVTTILRSDPFFRDRYEDAAWRRMAPSLGERTPLLGETSLGGSLKRLAVGEKVHGSLATKAVGQLKSRYGAAHDLLDRITVLNKFDEEVARVAIAGRLAEAKARGMTGDAAKSWAARQSGYDIRRTNNTHSALDMSDIAYQHRGDLISTALMYTSDLNKSYNLAVQAIHQGPKQAARTFAALGAAGVWAAGVAYAVKRFTDRDKKDVDQRAFEASVREGMQNAMPFYGGGVLGDFGMAVFRKLNKEPTVGSVQVMSSPAFQVLESLIKGGIDLAGAIGESGRFKAGPNRGKLKAETARTRALKELVAAGARLAGIPSDTVWRWVRAFVEN